MASQGLPLFCETSGLHQFTSRTFSTLRNVASPPSVFSCTCGAQPPPCLRRLWGSPTILSSTFAPPPAHTFFRAPCAPHRNLFLPPPAPRRFLFPAPRAHPPFCPRRLQHPLPFALQRLRHPHPTSAIWRLRRHIRLRFSAPTLFVFPHLRRPRRLRISLSHSPALLPLPAFASQHPLNKIFSLLVIWIRNFGHGPPIPFTLNRSLKFEAQCAPRCFVDVD